MCFDDETKKEIIHKFDMEIDDAVNYVFRHFQRIYQIESGDEPFDTRINELQKELAEECTRVLEFQLPSDEDKNPDEFVFRIKKSDFNDPDALEEGIKDMKLLIGFLCNANPNYYLLGNVLQEQLKEQLNKKEETNE